jgi:hypothetical protein
MSGTDDPRPYYYRMRGTAVGPFELAEMQSRARRGMIGRGTEVSRDGSAWRKAADFPELFRKPNATVAPPTEAQTQTPAPEPTAADDARWYIVLNGVQQPEPVPLSTVQQYVAGGMIKREDVVCKQGWSQWAIVRSIPELAMCLPPAHDENKPREESSNGMAIAGFVLSLLGCGPLGFIFSLVALGGKNQTNRGLAIAGAIIGGIQSLCCVVGGVWWLMVVIAASAQRLPQGL